MDFENIQADTNTPVPDAAIRTDSTPSHSMALGLEPPNGNNGI